MTDLTVFAAGSLEAAFGDIIHAFRRHFPVEFRLVTGPSGLLRQRVEAGETCDLFASADIGHPAHLANAGLAAPLAPFARNRLAVLAHKRLKAAAATLIDLMLDPEIKVGTSTPGNDPSGDYAWAMFRRADILRPGSFSTLASKALQITGGAGEEPGADLHGPARYRRIVEQGEADLFVTYLTTAAPIAAESEQIDLVQLPDVLSIESDMALTVVAQDRIEAWRFAYYVLSAEGRTALARRGFQRPSAPPAVASTRG